jgi:replication factor A1
MSLTQGALLTICQGGTVECPNLQLLSFKRIAGSSSERYRLLVSDGMYSNSYAMLATQLNNVITDNLVDNNCIIRVNKMQCNIMQGKKVIIILDLDVLRSGTQVGQKLGTPIAINADGTVSENDRQAVAATGQKAGKRTGEEADNQPIAKKPLQQQSHNRPSMLSATSGTDPSHLSIYPIASLTPYQNKWTIKARVTNKTDIRRWSNSRGEGHLFSMDLVDESGEIRATAFKEQCDKYYNMVEIGKVFYFTSGTLKSANRQYSTLNNEYEMTFRDTTEVIPCTTEEETASIPTLTFNFCQIGQLDASLKDSNVDIIAVVKAAGDVVTITSSRTQKELRKRDITLVDKSLVEVGLTLWGGTADNFDATGNPVVAIKGAKVSDYNGVSLSCSFSSVLQINPDLPQCHELKGWYEAEGSKATTSSITSLGEPPHNETTRPSTP